MKLISKKRFKAIRERHGLTVAEAAKQMGYSKESIYKKESGDIAITQRDIILLGLLRPNEVTA